MKAETAGAPGIAIVGMACRYPDADTPAALWENVVAKRRAFRRLPDERLRESDYVSTDRNATDSTYRVRAAVLEGFAFDRERFRVPGDTFRSADMAHWLALQVAADALEDAGWPEARELPRDATGVLLGNTLTGEFSRANVMRLRWPYVRRIVDAALSREDWSAADRLAFLERLEPSYKAPFPEVGGETLAGGLANTIAGRICNQFDLHGGGYTVDGACASSLLAVTQACSALVAGDLDVALAGGVDLSLDPFELVGFARLGALAPEVMHVYDERSAGFWPGEGCGIVVLMRQDEALRQGRRIYATLQGWGVSSDGQGGLTRPEVQGQLLAVRRAYARAGYGADSVGYFEGHGTGTAVGDPAEIHVLSQAIREAAAACPHDAAARDVPPAALGSIKANIGHTKAAAGAAGLIKSVLSLHHRILPPTTACEQPTALLRGAGAALRVLQNAEAWPGNRELRASVSAMGFGGINTHVTLRQAATPGARRTVRSRRVVQAAVAASRSLQDHELFCFRAATPRGMLDTVERIASWAHRLSLAEMSDLSRTLATRAHAGDIRAAILAATPENLATCLATLRSWLQADLGDDFRADDGAHVFLGRPGTTAPRLGLLFPGQASPSYFTGGAWSNRFAEVQDLYAHVAFPADADPRQTAVAQPAICCAARAGLLGLQHLGLDAQVAIGHSVGELAALHWAGVYDQETLLRLATARGDCMSRCGERHGGMASIGVDAARARQLVQGSRVVVAGMNAPEQTIVSGDAGDIQRILQKALQQGLNAVELRVSHAFHSPHMLPAVAQLRELLQCETWQELRRTVISTITGTPVTGTRDLTEHLVQQLVEPVRFTQALQRAEVDLWIECGPGSVLSGLVRQQSTTPVVALDAGSTSLAGLLRAFAHAWALGADVDPERLGADRFTRPFTLDWKPRFFENPCEQAPWDGATQATHASARAQASPEPTAARHEGSPLDVVRQRVADHLELPVDMVRPESQLLGELHLNSITIGEIVARAARDLGLEPPQGVTEFANASVADIAAALTTLRDEGASSRPAAAGPPDGVDAWIRTFEVDWVEEAHTTTAADNADGRWKVLAASDHPFAARLQRLFTDDTPGGGVVVCMPPQMAACCADLLLQSAGDVLSRAGARRYVVVQDTRSGGAPGGGFARTLHLENPTLPVTVVDLPWDAPEAEDRVLREALSTTGFREVRYDEDGRRRVPRLQLARGHRSPFAPTPDDVVLVTGGGKGIAAECALELARRTGARLALLGRSDPARDDELAANLERFEALGARMSYLRCDVTDAQAVRAAHARIVGDLGPVTAVLHAAGSNTPQRLETLDEPAFRRTFAPKVLGLRNVLESVDAARLGAVITFSSIIGRVGLAGEADYALANEWASHLTCRFQEQQPHCLCLSLEWSVWSGSGMGERLGRVAWLRQQGVADIPTDAGVATFMQLLEQPPEATAVVVSGRFGDPPTVAWKNATLPLRRFIETPRLHVPGVELIVDATLQTRTDPYLQDHVVQRQPIFPAVLGLEAMAQVAMALAGSDTPPVFENVSFQRPVIVDDDTTRTIRVAALQTSPGDVTVTLRSDAQDFTVDSFRAVCRFGAAAPPGVDAADVPQADPLPLDPGRHLYNGQLLFHRGRFQRLCGYRILQARACDADVASDGATEWFGTWMPRTLCLGDPAARDAAIHAIQACIPHARLLPVAVERLHTGRLDATRAHRVRARERAHEGDEYVYDMSIEDDRGNVIETWVGLRLRRMEAIAHALPWPPELFGPYAERRLQEVLESVDERVSLALRRDTQDERGANTEAALRHATGGPVSVWRRPDGKPQSNGASVTSTHAQGYTLALTGSGRLGCDLQEVTPRTEDVWRDLLGETRLRLAQQLATDTDASLDAAATQIWSAVECLKKAGLSPAAPLTLEATHADGWTALRTGDVRVVTSIAAFDGASMPMAIALLAEASDARV